MKSLLITVFLGIANSLMAQVPVNLGFEEWVNNEPSGWWTTDQASSVAYNSVSQSTDMHSGNYAVRLEVLQNPEPGEDPVPAVLSLDPFGANYSSGLPYSLRPEKLSFWIKYETQGTDSILIYARLGKYNGTSSDLVGGIAAFLHGTSPGYQQVELPFNYLSNNYPDSIRVYFLVGMNRVMNYPTIGTYAVIDDIEIDVDGVMGLQEGITPLISLYPNPANGVITIGNLLENSIVTITSLRGELLFNGKASSESETVDISGISAGIYTLKVVNGPSVTTQKIVIE